MSDVKKETEATEETVEIPVTDGSEERDSRLRLRIQRQKNLPKKMRKSKFQSAEASEEVQKQ